MKILFITRKYPPQIGGMENYSYNLIKHIPCEKEVIFLGKKQWHLIWWLPYVFFRVILSREKFDAIFLCDGLLAPLGTRLRRIKKVPVFVTCHGLDVTYSLFLYQKIVIPALRKLDKIICVSRATLEECAKRGISREKLVFIPNGIEMKHIITPPPLYKGRLGGVKLDLQNKNVLLTVGRLVRRKGVAWFCENVMTKMPKNITYLIVGAGPEKSNIENIIEKYKLKDQIFLLGKLSNEDLEKVYTISDIFLMPNIAMKNDIEGFGLVALEAINYGLPVVAADLEGISDAIKNNENGILVQSGNAKEFIRQINILLKDQEKKQALILRARKYNQENFNWPKITQKYLDELQKLI